MHDIWRVARGAACLALTTLFAGATDGASAIKAMQLSREAQQAMEAKEFAVAIEKLEAAIELRPDYGQLHLELATARAAAEKQDDAVLALQRFASMGLTAAIDRTPEFTALKSRREFQDLTKAILANGHPNGSGEVAFSLRDVTGLIEGIVWREKTGEFYFGDVHARTVWVRANDGALRRLTPESEDLLGVFGLAIDEGAGVLWAATAAVPAMRGFAPELQGETALVEIDLQNGSIRRSVSLPRAPGASTSQVLTDLALAPDGAVVAIDAETAGVWRLPAGGSALQQVVQEGGELFALRAIAVLASGVAVVADQMNGLVRVDLARGKLQPIAAPADTTLVEINSLTLAPDGTLLALQTGVRPNRVLSIAIDENAEAIAGVTVLDSGHVAMGAPSQGCIATNGDFFFVANAGWSRFPDSGGAEPTPPRQIPIFRTKLPKPRG